MTSTQNDILKSKWEEPHNIDLRAPFLYFIKVTSPTTEYRYIGKASNASRITAYSRNVSRILDGQPSRPLIKENGERQSDGNISYRYVHLVLATAVKNGWCIECRPFLNCTKSDLSQMEQDYIKKHDCNMNEGEKWFVEDFEKKSKAIK